MPSQPYTLGSGRIAGSMLLGIPLGLALSWIVDRLVDGPGILAMVGF